MADVQGDDNTQPYQAGFLHAAGSDLWGAAKGMAHMAASTVLTHAGVPDEVQRNAGITPISDSVGQQLANIPAEWRQRKQEHIGEIPGHPTLSKITEPVYRAAAVPAGFIANIPGMEEAARQGDVGGVAGHMAAGQAMAAAPLIAEGVARGANRIIPSTTRAGLGLQGLTDAPDALYAQHPTETPKALDAAKKIETQLNVTGEKPPPVIQHYLAGEQLRNLPPEFADQLRAQGIQPAQPMTMYEARTMLKRVNDIIDASRGFTADTASKTMVNTLKRFASALDQDISTAAEQGGFGDAYRKFRNEYAAGKGIIRTGDQAAPYIGGAIGAGIGKAGGALGMAEGGLAGGVVGKVAQPVVGSLVRSVIERGDTAKFPALPPIPRTSEEYLRTMLAAKEGAISPGEMERRLKRGGATMKVQPLPQPPQ